MIVLSFDIGSESLKSNLVRFDGHSIDIMAEAMIGY